MYSNSLKRMLQNTVARYDVMKIKYPRNPRIFAGAQECINSRGSYRAIHNIPPLCPIHSLHFAVCCRGRAASCKNVVKHAQVLWWNSTVWGGRLCKRFCNMFSRSSSCFTWAAWQLQFSPTACGTLRKHVTKPFPQPAAPDCIMT